MDFHSHSIRSPATGDVFELRETDDGRWVCPICGYLLSGNAPYNLDTGEPSFDNCPCCDVEYGYEDAPEDFQIRQWAVLREKWLNEKGRQDWQLEQVRNLGEQVWPADKAPEVSSLVVAAAVGHLPSVVRLLNKGCDLEERNERGETALIRACIASPIELVRLLVDADCDVNAADARGYTALHHAARANRVGVVNLLLDSGADPNPVDKDGFTPILRAICAFSKGTLPLLIAAWADLGVKEPILGGTPLIHACRWGDPEVIRLLMVSGADLNARDLHGATPLHWLLGRDSLFPPQTTPGVRFLREGLVFEGIPALVEELLAAGADPNAATETGITPLMLAAHSDNPDAFRILLDQGANPDAVDSEGRTAADHAAETSDMSVFRIIEDMD